MRALIHFAVILHLGMMTLPLFSQNNTGSAVINGKILFEQDSIQPLKPYSVVIRKDWPITLKHYEQIQVDTTDFTFQIHMNLDQLTYGSLMVNFFKDIDSTVIENGGARFPADLPERFYNREYSVRVLLSGVRLVIEPGDRLNLVIDYNTMDEHGQATASFLGIGSANNNYNQVRDLLEHRSDNYRVPLLEGLDNEDQLTIKRINELNEAYDSISVEYFALLKNDILFDNLGMKHALIRAWLNSQDLEIEKRRELAREYYAFLDTLTFRPDYVNSRQFRSFLDFYLEYLNRIITGDDVPFAYDDKSYWLAKAVYEKEVLKTFLYMQLASRMEVPLFYNSENFQYEDFVRRFPDTQEAYRLTRLYNLHLPVTNGQPAPDLVLVDSLGRTKHLTELKGKVLIISSAQAWLWTFDNDIKRHRIESLHNRMGNEKLIMIAFGLPYRADSYRSPYIDYYVNMDENKQNVNAYRFSTFQRNSFIISKNGIIKDLVQDMDVSDEILAELYSERYTLLTRWKAGAQKHITGIVIILSFLLSLTLVLYLTSRLRHRRQDLIKRQLKSELKAIRSQLNPHFLFNSLNSIQNFINKSDSKAANMHLSRFSLLMRKVIELSEKESSSLEEELAFIRTYVELEQLRYGFSFKLDVEETIDTYNTEIPSLIIQPFVENAIVHAMADLGTKGELIITISETALNEIVVEISDNGKGFPADARKGFGLKSSRERIDLLNSQQKEKISLQLVSSAHTPTKKGTRVKLVIPKKY